MRFFSGDAGGVTRVFAGKDFAVKLVQAAADKSKSSLVACSDTHICHNVLLAKDGDEPYYFQTPASMPGMTQTGPRKKKQLRLGLLSQVVAQVTVRKKKQPRLGMSSPVVPQRATSKKKWLKRGVLLGVVVAGIAVTVYTMIKLKKTKLKEMDVVQVKKGNYGRSSRPHEKENTAKLLSKINITRTVAALEKLPEVLQAGWKKLRLATVAALLGVASSTDFVDDLADDEWWDRLLIERVILLFSRGEELTLTSDDLEKFVKVLTKHLPARKDPQFFNLAKQII